MRDEKPTLMMNILVFRPSPIEVRIGSYNLQEIGLAKALIRKGHNCDVAYYTSEKVDRVEQIRFDDGKRLLKVLWLHGFGAFYEGIYPSLKKYLGNYDIIQVGGYIGIMSCWLNRNYQDKIINYQGPYFCLDNKGDIIRSFIWDHLLLPFSHKKDMIVGTKSKLATNYVLRKGINNVETLGVGLDADNLKPSIDVSENDFIQKLEHNKQSYKYMLYIGALEPRRNTMFLFDIAKKVMEKDDSIRLIVIGDGKKDYINHCFDYLLELNIGDKVFYEKQVSQKYLQRVYELSCIFLLPTKYEIFGMVLLEAMFYGLPVITTYNGGSSTLMTDKNGIIIDNFDVEIWAEKVIEILEDAKLRKQIGNEAKKTIVESYTWDRLSDKFIELYNKRLNNVHG